MLSIRDELKKLAPVELASHGNGSPDPPADLLTQWQQIAAGIADITAGQRRTVEQLESFLQSVRGAAADTQRAAAASREFLEDQRALFEKDRTAFEQTLQQERVELQASVEALRQRADADIETVKALAQSLESANTVREKAFAEHLRTARHELEAVLEPLGSAALDFREIAVGLTNHLAGVESLRASIQSQASAIRAAVSEELRHRHDEMERLQSAAEESAKRTSDQVANAVAALDEAMRRHSAALAAEREQQSTIQHHSIRADLEAKSQALERAEEQLQATSRSMMAFLEALDDLSALSGDQRARNSLDRLASRAQRVLEAAGLTEIDAEGARVDEELHEVVQRVPAPAGVEAGSVLRVVQRGFRSGDRVVRRAQVVAAE